MLTYIEDVTIVNSSWNVAGAIPESSSTRQYCLCVCVCNEPKRIHTHTHKLTLTDN